MDQAVALHLTEKIPAGTLALGPPAAKFLPETVLADKLPGHGVVFAKVTLSKIPLENIKQIPPYSEI